MILSAVLLLGATAPEPVRPVGFDLSEPLPAAVEDPPALNKWTGSVKANFAMMDGDTDRTTIGAGADAEYRREKDRTTLKFLWNYAEDEESSPNVTQRQVRGGAKYDYFFNPKTYAFGETSGEYDLSAGIDLRATVGVGIGRQFREDEHWKLSGELGASYVDENYVVDADDTEYVAGRAAGKAEYKPNDKATYSNTSEIYTSLEDTDDSFARLDTKARFLLTSSMFAELQWLFTWDNTPAEDSVTGQSLNRTNDQYLLGVGWSF